MITMEEFSEQYNKQPLYAQLEFVRRLNKTANENDVSYGVSGLRLAGCLCRVEDMSLCVGERESDVYLWKHAWGEPFYVGSGKNDRWRVLAPRCEGFYQHIDQADAVVYRVIVGADPALARKYEKYLSFCLRLAGYPLANNDYCVDGEEETFKAKKFIQNVESDPMTLKVKRVVYDILSTTPKSCDYRTTCRFIETYGSDYFTRTHK